MSARSQLSALLLLSIDVDDAMSDYVINVVDDDESVVADGNVVVEYVANVIVFDNVCVVDVCVEG